MKGTYSLKKLFSIPIILFYSLVFLTSNFSDGNELLLFFISLPIVILFIISSNASLYLLISVIIGSLASESYLKFNFFYLSINYIFLIIYSFVFILSYKKGIKINTKLILLLLLFFASIISVIISNSSFALIAILLRFSIICFFIISLYSLNLKKVIHFIVLGVCIIPFTTFFNLLGFGTFLKFLTFNFGLFDTVYGSHVYLAWFAFLFPIIYILKLNKYIILLVSIFYSTYVYFSLSRSLLISVIISFFIFYQIGKKFTIVTVLKYSSFLVLIVLLFSSLQFFTFSMDKGSAKEVSNIQRFNKISNSIEAFYEKPFFGHGYGMSQIENKDENLGVSNEEAIEISTYTKFSPEVMPIQILAEVGLIGLTIFMIIFLYSGYLTFRCLKLLNIVLGEKVILIVSFGICLLYFINSNSFSNPLIYIFLFLPFIFYDYYSNKILNESIV